MKRLGWIGAGACAVFSIIMLVALYIGGYKADENPGSDWTMTGTLTVWGLGLVALIVGTIATQIILRRRRPR